MKPVVKILLVLWLLLSHNMLAAEINHPTAIWFLDGTVVWHPAEVRIDSVNSCIYYSKDSGDREKIAYFEEVFAITSEIDTLYFTYDTTWGVSQEEAFMLLRGINDGFEARHYNNVIVSFLLTYGSNLLLSGSNVAIRNIAPVMHFCMVAGKKIDTKDKGYYELGYEIGLKRRKVLETTAGMVLGLYAYIGTEALITTTH